MISPPLFSPQIVPLSPISGSAAILTGEAREEDKGVKPLEEGVSWRTVPGTDKGPGNVTQ